MARPQLTLSFRPLHHVGLLALCAALWSAASASAAVYKWVDEQGKVHYSDRKPPGQESEQLEIKNRLPAASQADRDADAEKLQQQVETLEQQQELEQLRAAQAEAEAAEAELRRENCTVARANLKAISENARVRAAGEDGTLRYLTPEEIMEQKALAQSAVDRDCD